MIHYRTVDPPIREALPHGGIRVRCPDCSYVNYFAPWLWVPYDVPLAHLCVIDGVIMHRAGRHAIPLT